MHTTINDSKATNQMSGVSDGTVAGTHFYNDENGEEVVLADVTVQQEGMSLVRIRFARPYGITSFVMEKGDTVAVEVGRDT